MREGEAIAFQTANRRKKVDINNGAYLFFHETLCLKR